MKSYENALRYEGSNAELRKDASERIKQAQIQLQNLKEAEEMMRQQAEQEKRDAAAAPPSAAPPENVQP